MSDDEQPRAAARTSSRRYAADVAGNFDPRVYKFASRAAAPLIGVLMSPDADAAAPAGARSTCARSTGACVIEGPSGASARSPRWARSSSCRRTSRTSTRWSSASRSSARACRPATYGAGKNLFTNPLLSFFMHNLGRLPRRPAPQARPLQGRAQDLLVRAHRAGLPLALLPRAARARARARVERKLKLGLAGTGVEAMARTAAQRAAAQGVLRPRDHQLPAHARGRDADRRLPLRGGQAPVHHRGRRVDAPRAHRGVHAQAARARRRLRHPLRPAARLLRQPGRRRRRVPRRARARGRPALVPHRRARARVGPDAARDAQYTRELGEAVVGGLRARHGRAWRPTSWPRAAFDKLRERRCGAAAPTSSRCCASATTCSSRAPSSPSASSGCATARGSSRRAGGIVLGPAPGARVGQGHPRRGAPRVQRVPHHAGARAARGDSAARRHAAHLLLPEPSRSPRPRADSSPAARSADSGCVPRAPSAAAS